MYNTTNNYHAKFVSTAEQTPCYAFECVHDWEEFWFVQSTTSAIERPYRICRKCHQRQEFIGVGKYGWGQWIIINMGGWR